MFFVCFLLFFGSWFWLFFRDEICSKENILSGAIFSIVVTFEP